jgi:hypothetical protein
MNLHQLNCLDKSFPESLEVEGQERNTTKCTRHPDKKVNLICTNTECPFKLMCVLCRKDHDNKCSRTLIYVNPNDLKDKNLHEEHHESKRSLIEEKLMELDEFGGRVKEEFGGFVDIMVKHWKNELKTMTKESLLEYAVEQLKSKITHHAVQSRNTVI